MITPEEYKSLRVAKFGTQDELAKAINRDRTQISRRESGSLEIGVEAEFYIRNIETGKE